VIRAGAGFATHDAHTLTAYDAAGRERWHYRRSDSGGVRIGVVRAFDDGRTLVLAEQPTQGGGPALVDWTPSPATGSGRQPTPR